jgi:hypothetical protein
MSAEEFKQMQARARSSPMFVLPLSKPGGFMTLLVNWQLPFCLFTSVEEYRKLGAGAPPHMTLTHYTGERARGFRPAGLVAASHFITRGFTRPVSQSKAESLPTCHMQVFSLFAQPPPTCRLSSRAAGEQGHCAHQGGRDQRRPRQLG